MGSLEEDKEQAEEDTKEMMTREKIKVRGARAETGGTTAEMRRAG